MTRRLCPGGCGRPATAGLYVCATCWHELPPAVQRRVSAAWRAVQRVADAGDVDGDPLEVALYVAAESPATFRAYLEATNEADTLLHSRLAL